MAYTHTVLSINSNIDVIDKYKELIELVTDKDSLYIRAREVVNALKQDNLVTNGDEGNAIMQVVAQLSGSATTSAINGAIQWGIAEKNVAFQKEELEYKIDQMKLDAQTSEFNRDLAEANKHYLQAKTKREMGDITLVNGDVSALSDAGKYYYENRLLDKEHDIKIKQENQIEGQTNQIYAQIHKLVADTYVNHGMFTGYTITNTGITGASKQAIPDITLSEMNKRVAAEQAKGYALNAYGTAASSSSGMIGTLIAAEIPSLDITPYLNSWKASIDKLNGVTAPNFSQSSLSL